MRRFALVASLLVAIACGDMLGSPDDEGQPPAPAPPSPASDAGADPDEVDAADASPPLGDGGCDPSKAFVDIAPVSELNTGLSHTSARFTADELTVFMIENGDVVIRQRASLTAPFGAAAAIPELQSIATEQHPSVTADGLVLFFESTRDDAFDEGEGGVLMDRNLFVSNRASRFTGFGAPMPIGVLNTRSEEQRHPYPTPDGKTIYFSHGVTGQGAIARSDRGSEEFDNPVGVTEIDVPGSINTHPVITADGLRLYFGSVRAGGKGQSDIWVATRASTKQLFANAHAIDELSTNVDDRPTWISADGCRLYFTSTRDNVGGSRYDIFSARLPP